MVLQYYVLLGEIVYNKGMKIGDAIYVAGFFDGDGYVGIGIATGGSYYVEAVITQKERWVLENIQSAVGAGKLYKKGEGYHRLVFRGAKAFNLLEDIEPFMRVKKAQAKVAKMFDMVRKDNRLSWKKKKQRFAFFKKVIMDLNQERV